MSWTRDRKQDDYYGLDINKPSRDYPGRVYWAYDTGIVYIYAQDSNPYPMGNSTADNTLIYPVENYYADSATMFGDQGNQTEQYFQYVTDIDTYYEYLGTTNGDITDYRELTVEEVTYITQLLRGRRPIDKSYTDQASMIAIPAQRQQRKGWIYRVDADTSYWEYLGTQNGNISDYIRIDSSESPFEEITETTTGIIRTSQNASRANYGDIGANAVDMSISSGVSSTRGATGIFSFAFGEDVIASGYGAWAVGYLNNSSGTYSTAFGYDNAISSYAGFASGIENDCTGNYGNVFGSNSNTSGSYATAFGVGSLAKSTSAFVVGQANTDYSYTAGINHADNPMFIVGNGSISVGTPNTPNVRSDALIVYYAGEVVADSMTIALIDGWANGKVLTTREWVESEIAAASTLQVVLDAGNTAQSLNTNSSITIDLSNGSSGFYDLVFNSTQSEMEYYADYSQWSAEVKKGTSSHGATFYLGNTLAGTRWTKKNGTATTTVNFEDPTANATLQFPAPAAGTYTIATVEENGIYRTKVSLTATNVNNIGTTPITAIAAPGAGFVINVISAFANLTYGATAFDNNTLDLETSGAGGTLFTWSSFLDSTADNLKTADRTASSDDDLIVNTAVVLAGTDSVATGDSTVDVYITYEIVEL